MYWVFNRTLTLTAMVASCAACCVTSEAYGLDPMAPPGFSHNAEHRSSLVDKSSSGLKDTSIHDASSQPEYRVQQIVIRGELRRAVINEQVVKEGDRIGGAKVISIANSAVVIREQGKQTILVVQDDYPSVRQSPINPVKP